MDKKTDITEQIIRITEAKADIRSAIIEQGGGIDESAQIDTYGDKIREVSGSLNSRITVIENKIPAQASSENRLADKEFVNSSISTATATFRGTFDTLEALKATEADKNDYAFWVHKDEAGNTCYDKYTYDGSEWKFEYRLNNSSFTAAQWVAINSGITAEVIAALQDADKANSDAITKEIVTRTAADKTNADAIAKETADRVAADTALGTRIDTEITDCKAADNALQTAIDGKQATLVSGSNIKTVNGNSLLGSGNLEIKAGPDIDTSMPATPVDTKVPSTKLLKDYVDGLVADLQAQIDDLKYGELAKPLTFTIQEDGTIVWKTTDANIAKTIQYSKNGGDWTDLTATTGGASIDVVAGDILRFKGNNDTYASDSSYNCFDGTAKFAASGNIMSLIDGDNFKDLKTITAPFAFASMFFDCTGLTQAPALPATTLASNCYNSMFSACTGLTQAPALPATTLASYCYNSMFSACTGLTQAPALPVTTLANSCYYSMFRGCTGLTSAPALPATTLANFCYYYMFFDCTGLTQAPALPATTLASYCYGYMFRGCTKLAHVKCLATDISAIDCVVSWLSGVASSGTFVKAAAMTSWPSGASGIPEGWTVEDAA